MSDYQGWKNYETWNVKFWIDNDQGQYEYWREETRAAWDAADGEKDEAISTLADRLSDYHQEFAPEVHGTYADLLGAALSEVDWYEIAAAMIDDEDLPAAEDDTNDDTVQP